MKARIICNIANIVFEGSGKIDLVYEDIIICITNAVESKNGLYSQNMLKAFGTLIQRKNDEIIGIGQINLSGSTITSSEEFEKAYFKKFVLCTLLIDTFIQSLWFSKDNSASVTGSYFEIEALNYVNSKGASVVNYNSNGKIVSTTITPHDIFLATEIHQSLTKIMPKREHVMFDELPGIISVLNDDTRSKQIILPKAPLNYNHNDQNRIERALMFLHIARNHSYMLYRLAFFVPVLECLFGDSGNKAEITHKVAERVAFYIGKSAAERHECFNNVKDAYAIRSKFIHGDVFEKTSVNSVNELSPKIEEIARKVLKNIITKDSEIFLDDKKRSEYLKMIVFKIYSE